MSDNYIWQPVAYGTLVFRDGELGGFDRIVTPTDEGLVVESYDGVYIADIVLPDDLRLCRRVPSGAGVPAQEADASEQLLPCPFCGGTAHLLSYSLSAMAHCADCGASVAWQRGADAESAAIAGWNRRVPVDVPAPPQQEAGRE